MMDFMNAKMSKNFDKRLLNSMVGKQIPVDSFEEELKKIFRAKSRKNLWWSNIPTWIKVPTHTLLPNLQPKIYGIHLLRGHFQYNNRNVSLPPESRRQFFLHYPEIQ